MSGILALLALRGDQVDRSSARQLTKALGFRGPDEQRVWCESPAALGHALFRTYREIGRQPCSLGDGVHVVADLRLDGREHLIEELRRCGRRLDATASDPELLLHSYAAWNTDCVRYLLGDFSFAIWDSSRRRLFCARDPFGMKLLYYSSTNNEFAVSNTLDCLRAHPRVTSSLNELAIADFLLFGHNTDMSTTTFADIQRLPPAHSLTISCDGTAPQIRRYWTFPEPAPLRYRRSEDYVAHFRELWETVIGDRMRTDRISMFMSGGLDSTSIAAAAQSVGKRSVPPVELRAFSAYAETLYDDLDPPFARMAADFIGIPLELIPIDEYAHFTEFGVEPGLDSTRSPEPIDHPGLALTRMTMRRASEFARVALDGEDADAVLAMPRLATQLRQLPVGEVLAAWARLAWTKRTLRSTGLHFREALGLGHSRPRPIPDWINPDLIRKHNLTERALTYWNAVMDPVSSRPDTKRLLTSSLWQPLIEGSDPGVSRILLEVRYPMQDLRVISFVSSIPPLPWTYKKELLRAAMRGRLPDEVVDRPKTLPQNLASNRLDQLRNAPHRSVPEHSAMPDYVVPPHGSAVTALLASSSDLRAAEVGLRPLLLNFWLQRSV